MHAMAMNELLGLADIYLAARRAHLDRGGDPIRWKLAFGLPCHRQTATLARFLVMRAPPAFRDRAVPVIGDNPIGQGIQALERYLAVASDWRPRLYPDPPPHLWCDDTGAVLGVRGWRLTNGPKRGPRLTALGSRTEWPRGVMDARCRLPYGVRHRPAGSNCVCGIYAFKTAGLAAELLEIDPPVVGVVRAWGRVAVHRVGWRAERAQPLWLAAAVPPETARQLGSRYECDVVAVETTEDALVATATYEKEIQRWPG
jgi:hypothetical protein